MALAGFQALGFGLPSGTLLVVARELNEAAGRERIAEDRRDLERAGTWLLGAIQRSLSAQPNAINPELYRLSSLKRILGDTGSSASARKVLGAFVEALSVWDGLRVRCYAAGVDRGFFHFVSPVGAAVSDVPGAFDPAFCVDTDRLVRLEREAADDLGLAADPGDVLMLQLFAGADPGWLLFFSGAVDGAAQARLAVYADLLRESLDAVRERAIQRAIGAVPKEAAARNGTLEVSVGAVLHQIAAAAGGQTSSLTVTTVTGMRALTVGDQPAIDTQQVVVTSADAASVMTITLARSRLFPLRPSSAKSWKPQPRCCIPGFGPRCLGPVGTSAAVGSGRSTVCSTTSPTRPSLLDRRPRSSSCPSIRLRSPRGSCSRGLVTSASSCVAAISPAC